MSPSTVRQRGKLIEWNAEKAFGFADDGRQRVFIHIREFSERHKSPAIGDVLLYEVGADAHGRICAKNIVHANDGGRFGTLDLFILACTLALPVFAIARLLPSKFFPWCTGWITVTSLICYGFYAVDKQRARTREWRIPEAMLHTWELLGGWPGGFVAQRRLRHKSSKTSYLLVFWLIVMGHNYTAMDGLLDWRISKAAASKIRLLLDDPAPPKSRVY